jgi:hypothetical protein
LETWKAANDAFKKTQDTKSAAWFPAPAPVETTPAPADTTPVHVQMKDVQPVDTTPVHAVQKKDFQPAVPVKPPTRPPSPYM